jgi:hypothetical protein
MLGPMVNRAVCLGIKHSSGAYDQIFITLRLLWVFSDEKTGLSFIIAAGNRQRTRSGVLVQWDLRPYFTVSDLRLPFSSLPATCRVTVEVLDPASTQQLKPLIIPRHGQHRNLLRSCITEQMPSKAL